MSKTFDEVMDNALARPISFATDKGELVAILWTAMIIQSKQLGCPEIVSHSRSNIFPGNKMISPRFPNKSLIEFADTLRPWVEEYRNMREEYLAVSGE